VKRTRLALEDDDDDDAMIINIIEYCAVDAYGEDSEEGDNNGDR
jgi:hypothetical protein